MRAIDRFTRKVDFRGQDGCWLWTGKTNTGYGQFVESGTMRRLSAHRWLWEERYGPLEPGLQLDHLCRVRNCVNPAHLEPVTPAENVRRAYAARPPKTHCSHGHELTPDNTFVTGRGHTRCRECRRADLRRLYARRALEAGRTPGAVGRPRKAA